MSKIVVYDPGAAVVDAVIEYNPSANTPDYDSEPNKLVNPDLSLLEGIVPVIYWKRVGSTVVEMNQTEKETIDPQVPEERLLNEGAYDPPTENAGWEVDRGGVQPNASLMWNETSNQWEFGTIGNIGPIANDDNVIHTTGAETAAGDKTFTGDITIGHTFNSTYALSVQSNTANTYIEILNSTGAGAGVFFGIENYLTANDFALYSYQGGPITFYTDPVAGQETRRMVIEAGGDVGIGIDNPTSLLHVGGTFRVDGESSVGDIRIRHDSVSDSDIIFDANGRDGATGASISRDGSSGFLWLFPNSENVQWIAGSPAAALGANTFYIDCDMQGEFRINTLPGAGRGADVWITYDADLLPGNDATSNLGSATQQWNEVRAVTLYGDGSNITGLTDTGITQLTGDVTAGPGSGSQLATIANDAVTYAKMQNVEDDQRILGNIAGALGPVAELDASDVRTMINVADGATADQNIWLTINADSGTTTANSVTDTLTIAGATGLSTSISGDTVTLSPADDLAALEGISTTGIAVRTAANTWTTRTITASANAGEEGITIGNGNGVGANPVVGIDIDSLANSANEMAVDDEFIVFDSNNNVSMTGQQIADGVSTILGGFGDVTSSANITDHSIVRGDGGAKGVQDSDGTGNINATIDDGGKMIVRANKSGDYALEVRNDAASGNGFAVMGGEALGDIAFHIADLDDTFQIMEMEADQGYVTMGKTYAQTLSDNGVVYGLDIQHPSGTSTDFNTQAGCYRMGGVAIPLAEIHLFMDQVEYPASGDWAVNVGAPASPDSNNNALTVRLFDDTVDEALGFILHVPDLAKELRVTVKARAETAPGASQNAILQLYEREIPDNGAVTAWSSTTLSTMVLPTNELFQKTVDTDTLANWGLVAGSTHQFQLVRDANNGSDNLVGDLAVLEVCLVFM